MVILLLEAEASPYHDELLQWVHVTCESNVFRYFVGSIPICRLSAAALR